MVSERGRGAMLGWWEWDDGGHLSAEPAGGRLLGNGVPWDRGPQRAGEERSYFFGLFLG